MLWPGREIEVKLVLFSFSLVSDMQRMSNFKLFDVRSVYNSQSKKVGMRCSNEKMKDCIRHEIRFLDYPWHHYFIISVQ